MRNIIFCIAASLMVLGFASCYKDIGNYSYHTINQVSFQDFDTANGYTAYYNDSLSISPTLVSSENDNKEDDYTYEWSFRIGGAQVGAGLPPDPLRDSVVSTDKDLHIKIGLVPGTYSLQYRVTDKTSGIVYPIRTNLLITTQIYQGWLILNDVNGHSRLDMLSYNNNAFTQHTDVLQEMGSTVPHDGMPYEVFCMQYTNSNIAVQNYGIFLLTSDGTNRINQETFTWDPTYNIRYLMVGQVPQDFAGKELVGNLTYGSYPDMYVYDGTNVYSYSTFAGYAFKYTPLNVYAVSGAPFKVSPYMITDGTSVVMYNEDAKHFVRTTSYSSTTVSDLTASGYPEGLDLVYMERNYSNNGYAILKDASASKYYMLRFASIGAAPNYYEEIPFATATDFANATHYAVSPDLGYLFYSVGSKVYEYDLFLQKSILMLDKGNEQISYLAFQNFFNRLAPANAATYPNWAKYLCVGSYDPSGAAGNNGTFSLYSVPPVNGQIQQVSTWTGFGKVVSVSYRER